jgi:trk system potassium uptake protein TrkH
MRAPTPLGFERWRVAQGRERHVRLRRLWSALPPSRLLVGSFALLIAVGTLGFRLLPGLTASGVPLGWIDALFMATSAVCVTGLSVLDTGADLTFAGQLWILLLVQLGGLGLLTFTSGILLTVGRRLSLRHEGLMESSPEGAPRVDYRVLVRRVLRYTAVIELLGVGLLYVAWAPAYGARAALWPSVFHAVSAFCNAGFSTFSDSLVGQRTAGFPLLVVMGLVVFGGLGFLTLEELGQRSRLSGRRRPRLSLHARLVIAATLVLLVVGTAGFAAFEWNHTLDGLDTPDRALNALFGGVTPRTAGFNTVDYGAVETPTAALTIVLMFIGGAPGSTAGGVKVTTLALLFVLALARLRGQRDVSAFHRTIPEETIGRAAGLLVLAALVLTVGLLALVAVDPGAASHERFLAYMFEAVSAFGTVGLSMNLTPELSPGARLVVSALMFVGRVGVMTAAAALALGPRALPFRYAKEDVPIG